MWPPSGAMSSMRTVPLPLTEATALWLDVSSCQPLGMTVVKPVPVNARDAVPDGDVLELGVTVAIGDPQALSSSTEAPAQAVRARAKAAGRVTPSRIAEPSKLSRRRSRAQSNAWRQAPRFGSPGSVRHMPAGCPRSSTANRSRTSICAVSFGSVSRSATGGAHSRRTSSPPSCSGGRWWCRTSPTWAPRSRLRRHSPPARSHAWWWVIARPSWRCTTRFGRRGPRASCAIRNRCSSSTEATCAARRHRRCASPHVTTSRRSSSPLRGCTVRRWASTRSPSMRPPGATG